MKGESLMMKGESVVMKGDSSWGRGIPPGKAESLVMKGEFLMIKGESLVMKGESLVSVSPLDPPLLTVQLSPWPWNCSVNLWPSALTLGQLWLAVTFTLGLQCESVTFRSDLGDHIPVNEWGANVTSKEYIQVACMLAAVVAILWGWGVCLYPTSHGRHPQADIPLGRYLPSGRHYTLHRTHIPLRKCMLIYNPLWPDRCLWKHYFPPYFIWSQ